MVRIVAFWGGLCLLALVGAYFATSIIVCAGAIGGNIAQCAKSTAASVLQSPAAIMGLCLSLLAIQYSVHRRNPQRFIR